MPIVDLKPELFEAVLRQMPDDELLNQADPNPPAIQGLETFDQLYERRALLREGKAVLVRPSNIQRAYEKQRDREEEITGIPFGGFDLVMKLFLSKYNQMLTFNFFRYDLPYGTIHYLHWYDPEEANILDRAGFLTWKLEEMRLGINDFIYYKNIPSKRSVPKYEHYHVLVRSTPDSLPDLGIF